MAMRGHSSIQGSSDVPTLYDLLPGDLPQPAADPGHDTLDDYVKHEGLPTGDWAGFRKFIVSLLKAYYGDAATATYSELNSFYLLIDHPSVYGLPERPLNPWLRMAGDYLCSMIGGLAAIAALLLIWSLRIP
jgi:hypothetical protein